MRIGRMMGMFCAALTMVALATPAEAQRHRHGGHRHHDRVDGGDVLLGAVIAGGLIALIAGAGKNDRDVEPVYDAPPPPADYGEPAEPASYGMIDTADGAADACAAAAASEGQRFARLVSVGAVDAVDPVGSSWMVRGSLLMRDDYRERGSEHGFRCTIAGAGRPSVRIDGY